MKFKILFFFLSLLAFGHPASGVAQAHSVDLSNIKVLSSDISSDFFLDFQNISFQAETVHSLLGLIDAAGVVGNSKNWIDSQSEDSNLLEALFLIQKDDWDNARRFLLSADTSGPLYPLVLFLKGWADFKDEQYYRAIAQFGELLKEHNGGGYGIEASFLQGISSIRTGQFKTASEAFTLSNVLYQKESERIKELLVQLEDPEFALNLLRGTNKLQKNDQLPSSVERLLKRREFLVLGSILSHLDALVGDLSGKDEIVVTNFMNALGGLSDQIARIQAMAGNEESFDHEALALNEYLFFLNRIKENKSGDREYLKQILQEEIEDLVSMATGLKEEIGRTVTVEIKLSHEKMIESQMSIEPWIAYFTSRADYQNYLLEAKSEASKKAVVLSHTLFIERYPNWNYHLLKEVVNRLVEVYSEESGFSERTEKLFLLLTSPVFSGNADTVHSLYTLAAGYFEKNSYDNAEKLLLRIEKEFPKSSYSQSVDFLLGEIRLKNEDIYNAYTYYEKASEYVNSYYSLVSLYRRGWIHDKLYGSRKSIILYSELLKYIFEFNNGNMKMPVAEEVDATKKIVAKLKEEAVQTIADSLYSDGGAKKLFAFMDANEDNPCLIDVVKSFGNIYRIQKDFTTLIEIYTRFLKKFPGRHEMAALFSDLLKDLNTPDLESVAERLRSFFIVYYNDKKITLLNRSIFEDIAADSYVQSARYHNFLGRATGESSEFDTAVTLYREYIGIFGHKKNLIEVNVMLGDLLYEKGEYRTAGAEYFKIAWEYPSHVDLELQEKAALASVSSLMKYLETPHASDEKSVSQFYDSASKFVVRYPDNPETINIYFSMGERLFQEKEYVRAKGVFERIILLTTDRTVLIKAMQRVGQCLFADSHFADAEKNFLELQNYILTSLLPDSTDRSRIVFKVGSANYSLNAYERFSRSLKDWRDGKWIRDLKEQLREKISDTGSPKGVFLRYGQKFEKLIVPFRSDSKALLFAKDMILLSQIKRVDTLLLESRQDEALELLLTCAIRADDSKAAYHYVYRSGMILVKREQLFEAYKMLSFIEKNENIVSDSQYKYPVLMQLAYISDKLKKQQDMLLSLKKVTTLKNIQKSKKMDATLKAGLAYESIGNSKEALFMFEKYISASKITDNRFIEICFRAGNLNEQMKKSKKAIALYRKVIKTYKKIKDTKAIYYVANAHFNIAEWLFKKYEKITLRRKISIQLKAKKKALKLLISSYRNVVRYGVLEFTSAAYYKMGMAYELFGEAINKVPVPKKLTEEEIAKYKILLAKRVEPIRKRAINAYKKNLELLKKKNYNDWITLSLKGVIRLSDQYTDKAESTMGIAKVVPGLLKRGHRGFWIETGVSEFETGISVEN